MKPAASPPAYWVHKLIPWLTALATLACLLALLPPLPGYRPADHHVHRTSGANKLSYFSFTLEHGLSATNPLVGCLPLLSAPNTHP